MVSSEEEHWAVAKMEGVGKHVENSGNQEVMEYAMQWGNEQNYVKDEVEETGEDVDGWPRVGREHRWINVLASAQWGETERRELEEVKHLV